MPNQPDLMDILGDARQDAVEQLTELLRFGRGQITQPLPLSTVREKPLAEQVEDYERMQAQPELALAELSRIQADRGLVKPRGLLKHFAKMARESQRRSGGSARTPAVPSLDEEV